MADEVDTRISPALDPGVIELIEDYDEDTRPLLGQTETALSMAHKALGAIHDAKAAAATNPTLNEFAQLVQVDDYATKQMQPVMKVWGNAVEALNNNILSVEKELTAPIEQKVSQQVMASEIRAHFKGMKDTGERMVAIQKAINEGDAITATAVLGGRSYLSGLDDEIHGTFVREWQEKQMPVEAKKVRAMRKAADLLNDRVKILKKAWTDAVGVHEETEQDRQGRRIVTKVWTPEQVREKVRKANLPFAVPVGR
jgi:hypothetical protein